MILHLLIPENPTAVNSFTANVTIHNEHCMWMHVILVTTSQLFPPTTNLTIYQLQNHVFQFIMQIKLSDVDR